MLNLTKYIKALNMMGFSQEAIAEHFDVSVGTINNWINGKKESRASEKKVIDGTNNCQDNSEMDKDMFFLTFINHLDISNRERAFLQAYYGKNGYDSSFQYIIRLARSQTEFVPTVHIYEPNSLIRPTIGLGHDHILAVREDGHVLSAGSNDEQQCHTHAWRDIVSVAGSWKGSIGLKADGTCVAIGKNMIENGEIFRWTDVSGIACDTFHVLALKSDGTVLSFGMTPSGEGNVSQWEDIKGIAAGRNHSVGLRSNGTVIATGKNDHGQCDVESWSNVVQIAAGGNHTLALTKDGTVLATGDVFTYDTSKWKNIVAISTGDMHAVGLREDGTVINTGADISGLGDVERWHDMIAIAAKFAMTAGIRADGKVFVTHNPYRKNYIDTDDWKLFNGTTNADSLSRFNLMLEKYTTNLRRIHETALQLASFVGQYRDNFHDDIISPPDDIFQKKFRNLFFLSEDVWKMHKECHDLPTIARMAMHYSCAFVDFNNSVKREDGKCSLTEHSVETYETLLMTIGQLKEEIRTVTERKI